MYLFDFFDLRKINDKRKDAVVYEFGSYTTASFDIVFVLMRSPLADGTYAK